MRFATSNGKKLDHIRILPTPHTFDEAISLFKKSALGLEPKKIKKVIGGVPRFTNNTLNFWHTHPTKKTLEKLTKAKVELVNDAELGGLGEAVYGVGQDQKIVAYLTFSTGFGGSRIVNGKIDENSLGFEPDKQIAQFDLKKLVSTRVGVFTTGRGLMARHNKQPEKIQARKIWHEVEAWMCIAVNNAAVFWSPDIIVLGGGISSNKNISAERIQKFLDKRFANMPKVPLVKKATLGQLSGLYGALAKARE
jgi:glucokinase